MGLFTDYNVSLSRFLYGNDLEKADSKNTSFSFFGFPNIFSSNCFAYNPFMYNFPMQTNFMLNLSKIPSIFFNPITSYNMQTLQLSNPLSGTPKLINISSTSTDTFVKSSNVKTTTVRPIVAAQSERAKQKNSKPAQMINNLRTYAVSLNGVEIKKFGHVNVDLLQPDMKEKLVALYEEAERHGYTLVANDCYRSASAQAEGRKRKGNLCAPPNKSPHQYGCAFDLALYDTKGKQVDISTVPWFYNYAKNKLNLAWGQDWDSKKESWHFERKNWNKAGSDVYMAYCKNNNITPKQAIA